MFSLRLRMLFLFFVICPLFSAICHLSSAQETLTITTYYPSPFGSYRELRSQRMAMGINYINNTSVCWGGVLAGCPGGSADPGDATSMVVEGNVGIGTTGPQAPLHIRTTVGLSQLILENVGGSWAVRTNDIAANDFGIRNITGAITPFYIRSTGNVGIGTTNPGSKLSIVQGGLGLGMIGLYDGVNNDPTNYMQLGEDRGWVQYIANNAYYTGTQYNYVDTGGYGGLASRIAQVSGTIQLDTASGGTNPITWTNRMYINNNGNVGIGTTNPGARLEVRAGSEGQAGPVEAIRIWGPNSPTNANSAQDLKWDFVAAGSAGIRAYRDTSWGTHLQFLTNAQTQGSDSPQIRMHISEAGNVGIGMVPSMRLDVAQNTAIRLGQAYLSSGGNYAHLATNEWYNGSAWTGYAPGILLQFVGSTGAYIYSHNGAGAHTTWASVTGTSGWVGGSSKKYKQHIKTLADFDYEELRKQFQTTQLFSYNRKDKPNEPEVGFIAEYAPDLILSSDKDGVTLLKAIGYLAAIDKGQENAINSLQKEIAELKKELQELKRAKITRITSNN